MAEASPVPVSAPAESLGATLRRNLTIAAVIGAILALQSHDLYRWFPATLMLLWPTLGGHYLELAFLTFAAPHLPPAGIASAIVRLLTWLVGGVLFAVAIHLTGTVLGDRYFAQWPPLWLGAVGMLGIELIAHTSLRLRGRPSFFDAVFAPGRVP